MRWLQALAALLVYVWLAVFAAMMVVIHSHPAHGADLRRGELEIMARIVQAEATGEPALGAKAVAWTMLNRLRAGTYGKTLTRVMLAPHQYASPAPLDDSSDAYLKAMHATVSALLGIGGDPTAGSTHFARCDLRPQPPWMRTYERRAVIGAHCFFRKRR